MKVETIIFFFFLFATSFAIAWKAESTLSAVFAYIFFIVFLTGIFKNLIKVATKAEQEEDNKPL